MKREHKKGVEPMHFTGEKMGGREGRDSHPDAAVLYGGSRWILSSLLSPHSSSMTSSHAEPLYSSFQMSPPSRIPFLLLLLPIGI